MSNNSRPDTAAVLSQLKDFQRDTAEYVFRRMYVDPDYTKRFLIADEVGLGKTLVARGVIAKVIDHLWRKTRRIDVVYVCSNSDIARQNINRLNVTGHDDFSLSSRITLLPITVESLNRRRVNFISFTPGTSFDVGNNPGWAVERQLLFWLLMGEKDLPFNRASRVMEGYSGTESFRRGIEDFKNRHSIHGEMAGQFLRRMNSRPDLWQVFDQLCEAMPRAGVAIPPELHQTRNRFVGELRKLLAQSCLQWLEPDLIILDEFQRFKHLLQADQEDAPEAAQLAQHLFNYQPANGDPGLAARVLLLSATPYKMYTLHQESEQDDHYQDFRTTMEFLSPSLEHRQQFDAHLTNYREQLFQLTSQGGSEFLQAKANLEQALRRVMVRTERLAVNSDRNGMLASVPLMAQLTSADVQQYLALQKISTSLGHQDLLEFWKSSPYLLNFMEDYDFKRKLRKALESQEQSGSFVQAIKSAESTCLNRTDLEKYRRLDPSNARLRALYADTIEREAWRLLWIPPSLPYYEGIGPFADSRLTGLTKRLVFSCWRVVPKTIASVLSYEAERSMMQTFRAKAVNTAEARKKRRALLRFAVSKQRLVGMPVLGMVYPSRLLAERCDPLLLGTGIEAQGEAPTLDRVLMAAEAEIKPLLAPIVEALATASPGPPDESWYWAAPLLLDAKHDEYRFRSWIQKNDLAETWHGGAGKDGEAHGAWTRHVQTARDLANGKTSLGTPPEDLVRMLALLSIAAPGVVARRSLQRVTPTNDGSSFEIRDYAGPIAHAFLHLFNLPEVMALLRDRRREMPYWRSVLEYAAAGNLQAVLDEYAHVLVESLGLVGKEPGITAAKVATEIQKSLTLRTSTAKADLVDIKPRSVKLAEEPLRLRTRFAMRFGDQEMEDSSEPTRADQVRSAFNSPFWPFVLATTSVGQEGLDFHPYCHAVVHWNLPSNPVDLEQREGRVHRYKGHALRKNIAASFASAATAQVGDPWQAMFEAARSSRPAGETDLNPYWLTTTGNYKIERHVPALPHSKDVLHYEHLRRSLALYRMVFGQSRQEDLVAYLASRLSPEQIDQLAAECRIDLAPPRTMG
jgi:hypothetical protein